MFRTKARRSEEEEKEERKIKEEEQKTKLEREEEKIIYIKLKYIFKHFEMGRIV